MVQSVCFEGKVQQKGTKLIQTVNRDYLECCLQVSNFGCFKTIIKHDGCRKRQLLITQNAAIIKHFMAGTGIYKLHDTSQLL